ncbi:hypothetical protein K8R62_01885 [bacterium]|nr:hypothetical protein [bacterium]
MKIIFSRKGFDSSAGGYPSPIINNKLLSLPIPDESEKKGYTDLWCDDINFYQTMQQLIRNDIRLNDKKIKLDKKTKCHFDPDIDRNTLKNREKNWRPMFGQIDGAQTHLKNQDVQIGDLFLFFGWFKFTKTTKETKRLMYCGDDKHIIWGYFEIGQIIKTIKENKEYWKNWAYNPHIKNNRWLNNESNTLYIASKKLSFNSNLPGAGKFNYSKGLVLTKNGHPRTYWDLPKIFKGKNISHHSQNSWRIVNGEEYFQSNPIGQEFVVEDNKQVEQWAINNIINKHGKL